MPHTDDEGTGERLVDLELLRARAGRYARRKQTQLGVELRVLTFARGKSTYAVALDTLREVRPWPKLCPIPGASAVVPGVFQYRGELLSAHDPGRFMGLDCDTSPQWMLVLEHEHERMGIIADDVLGIRAIAEDALQPVPVMFAEQSVCFAGVVAPDLLVLDAPKLFGTPAFFAAF